MSDTVSEQRPVQRFVQQRLSFGTATRRWAQRSLRRLKNRPPEYHNERVIYSEVIFQAIVDAGAMSFISVFLVRLGAPNWLVGLYTALPAALVIVSILPMGALVQRSGRYVATMNWGRGIFRAGIGMMALMPFFPAAIAPYVLVTLRSLLSIPGAAINVSMQTIWGLATPSHRRARMLSTRMAIQGIFAAAFGLLSGHWLDYAPFPFNYQILFLTAVFAGAGSILVMSKLRLPETPVQEQPAKRQRIGIKEIVHLIKGTPAFRDFAIAAFVFRLGAMMPSALWAIFRVRTLGSSDSWIGILMTVERLLSVVAYFGLSRLLTRPKVKRWLWVVSIGMALFPITMALSTNLKMLLIPAVFAGLFGAGMNIFMQDTLFQVSPEDQRPMFVAANTFLANIIAFAAPLLGTFIADLTTIRTVFWISAVLRIASGVFFWRLGVGGAGNRTAQPIGPGVGRKFRGQ